MVSRKLPKTLHSIKPFSFFVERTRLVVRGTHINIPIYHLRYLCVGLSVPLLSLLPSSSSRRSTRSSQRSTRILLRRRSNSTARRDYGKIISIIRNAAGTISR